MKLLTLAVAISLALLGGCDRKPTQPPSPKTDGQSSAAGATVQSSTTAADTEKATTAERKDGSNPVQGQVDPKEGVQHRDFQQRGDGAGPKSNDTAPKPGN